MIKPNVTKFGASQQFIVNLLRCPSEFCDRTNRFNFIYYLTLQITSTPVPPASLGPISPSSAGVKTNPLGVFVPSVDDSLVNEESHCLPFNISGIASPLSTVLPTNSPLKATDTSSFVETITEVSRYRCKLCGFQSSMHKQIKLHVLRIHCPTEMFEGVCFSRTIKGWTALIKHASTVHAGYKSIIVHEVCEKKTDYLNENIEKIAGFGEAQNGKTKKEFGDVQQTEKPADNSSVKASCRPEKTLSPIILTKSNSGNGMKVVKGKRTVLNIPSYTISQKMDFQTSDGSSNRSIPGTNHSASADSCTADGFVQNSPVKKELFASPEG